MDILSCAGVFNGNTSAANTFEASIGIARTVVRILQILVPVALIVWGTLDLGKAVIEGDEKKMKEKENLLFKELYLQLSYS